MTARPFRWTWIVTLGTGVAVAFGTMFYAMSVMLTDEAAGGEFSTSALSIGYGGMVLVGGGLAFLIGRHLDRSGVRNATIFGFALGAVGLVGFGRATEPWHAIAAFWLLLGPAGALTFYEPAFVAVDQWFDRRHRARALAVLTLIGGLAGPLFLPLTDRLVSSLGWRNTTLVLAGLMAAAGAANVSMLPRGIPFRTDTTTHGAAAPGLLWRDARFVLFTGAMALSFGAFQTVLFHRIAAFEEAGFAVASVTLWAAASSLLSLPGRYVGPYLAERFGGIALYAASALTAAAAVSIISGAGSWRMPVHFVVFGITFGAMLPIRAVVMARWYSGESYGRAMGAQWSAAAVAGAGLPALTGVIRDRIGEYGPALYGVAALFTLAALVALISGRRDRAAGGTRPSPRSVGSG